MADSIVAEPLEPQNGFNWVFLVELLISTILTVFFLFYFNRLFATLVSYGIRAYTWHTYHAYIDIQALQISLLGGRLFFKDIRYHGHNETILVHGGYITWNYWLRRVRDADVYSDRPHPGASRHGSESPGPPTSQPSSRSRNVDRAEKGGKQPQKKLPCRISIKVQGVEAFMYNRSPAYDSIIDAMQRKTDAATKTESQHEGVDGSLDKEGSATTSTHVHNGESPPHKLRKAPAASDTNISTAETDRSDSTKTKKDDLPSFLRLLPIYLECNKGALVVGNENTLSVITAQFERASGEIDASPAGQLDVYQQVFNLQFVHPVVHLKPNPDFKMRQLDSALHLKQEAEQAGSDQDYNEKEVKSHGHRRWLAHLPHLSGLFSSSADSINTHPKSRRKSSKNYSHQWQIPGQENWKGLTRYLDESHTDGLGEWDNVEYAKTSLIVDCPCVNVSFYWDVAGPVPNELENSAYIDPARPEDINGSVPPEYGMDIQVYGGTINYGPWVDRHRGIFQSMFFPGANVDATPASSLETGDLRVLSIFKLYLGIEEDTVLRIPIREPSKDWRWKGKAHTLAGHGKEGDEKSKGKPRSRKKSMKTKQRDSGASGQNVRPFAWIDVKVSGNSSVDYVMDMVASENGFSNKLGVDIVSTEISSSVNHGLLWRSGPITLNCDLSNPLSWNSLRKWNFNAKCQDLELFLLRDHLFLLTDLVADWGSGPPSDYFTFVPFQYLLDIEFTDFKLYLNTNDSNIVNNPSDLDDNNFIILYGQRLHGSVVIPLDKFRPLQNEIQFDVRAQEMGLEVSMPSKNTLNTFLKSNNVAQLGELTLTGSHTFVTETSTKNSDRLFMNIQGDRLHLELYGWLIQHFMKLKDNYFGDFMHFKTLEEFQGLPSQGQSPAPDTTAPNGQPAKISNDLDVILCLSAENTSVLLPANLYSAENGLRADLPYAYADLRFTNYYMDLMVNFSPISISLGIPTGNLDPPNESVSPTEMYIDSVGIIGHRLFGLPPTEPTYVCNWEFQIGKVTGECTSDFIEKAVGAGRAFAFTFDDDENTLSATELPTIHDATFLRLKTQHIHVWFHVAQEVLLVSTGSISLDFNDLAGTTFSQRLNAWLPDLTVSVVDARSASRHRTKAGEKQTVQTHAFLQTTLSFNMFRRKLGFTEEREKQQAHIQEHDQRTNRAQFLFIDYPPTSFHQRPRNTDGVRPPAMPYPEIPHPIFLFQPLASKSAPSVPSDHSSSPSSIRGRHTLSSTSRSTSSGSLGNSIRSTLRRQATNTTAGSSKSRTLLSGTPPQNEVAGRFNIRISERERSQRNLPPSSVALSSPFAAPYFPLDHVEPDLSDVPSFPPMPSPSNVESDEDLAFNDAQTKHFDESFDHVSLLVSAEPGIRIHCTTEAIRCVSNLVELVLPHRPEDLLDDFQTKVMTKILDKLQRREGVGKSFQSSIRIPFVHFRFQNSFLPSAEVYGGKDQYDVILNRLKVTAGIKTFSGERASDDSVSLHTTLGSLGISVTERTVHGPSEDVAVQAEIRDLLVWMQKIKETSVNITFKAFETAAASRKVEYLASLIHRTTLLGEEFIARFTEIQEKQQKRLRYLAWFLTNAQDRFSDPAFLTKASYALRAARDHLRSHDSWKIMSRFRYIWQCLPENEKVRIRSQCFQQPGNCPEDVEERTINMWDQWRTWDLAHVKKSLAMIHLFGSGLDQPDSTFSGPLYFDIRSACAKLIIDPGPRQSEAAMRILAINVALLPPSQPSGLMLIGTESPRKTTIVQVNSRECSVHIHWEICELIESSLKMFLKQNIRQPKKTQQETHPKALHKKSACDHDLQVVFVTEKTQVTLDTINLRSVSIGQRFRFSAAGVDNKASTQDVTLTGLIHLDNGTTELYSNARLLIRSQLNQPSLYVAHQKHADPNTTPDEIKVAGASHMINVRIEEDILGILEVVDYVIRDEVAYFHEQATLIQEFEKAPKDEVKANDKNAQLPNITLALLMDAYQVDFAVLTPLTWSVIGSSGRISVVPTLGQNVTLRIDYDLEAHTHRMYSSSLEESNVISSLELPPVNGRLICTKTESQTRVSASGIIETVQLQASEVQALISTINKPEMATMLRAVQDDIGTLKTHIKEAFPETTQSVAKTPERSRDFAFDVQMTLSGLDVSASAPGQHPESATANLSVHLASIQLKATNIGADKSVMVLPEAIVNLLKISIEMTLTDSDSVRRCGNLTFGAILQATAEKNSQVNRRVYRVKSSGLEVNIFADTASAVVDVMNHLQDKIKDLDLSKERRYLRRLRHTKSRISQKRDRSVKSEGKSEDTDTESMNSGALFTSTYSLELLNIQVSWIVGTSAPPFAGVEPEDLVLLFRRINLSTRKDDAARLTIEDTQLQMVPISQDKRQRSSSSALLPEMVFNVAYSSTKETRKIAFHAAGKSLDLRLDSRFILPANVIERSIALAGKKFRTASANWNMTPTTSGAQRKNPFGNKRMASLFVDASFAGAVVHINGSEPDAHSRMKEARSQQRGRYSQFVGDGSNSSMVLRAPGVALKVEYQDDGHDPSVNAELRIDGSSNTLYPTVVPVMIDLSESIKEVVKKKDEESPDSAQASEPAANPATKLLEEDNLITADPSAILGRTRLNLGLRICKQDFSLSCQPIARVVAITKLEDIYVTVSSVKSQEHGHFFAASATFEKLQATVQHVYSRESTFGFDVDSVVLSLMNSKHLSGTSGISAILKINPMALQVNARQLQDFLLFREIWVPPEIRQSSSPPTASLNPEPQEYLMQRYQQVTAATAFPWNANVAIADVAVELDLGQAIGKTSFHIHNMWASSKKGTDWEQNLCVGIEKMAIESTGRTSGIVELAEVRVRTSISWPPQAPDVRQTPLIQASMGFRQLRVKSGFDYQAFVVADIANFDFLMYNVREQTKGTQDRLVAILDGDKVHVFCHATSASQGLALWQAIERLIQENQQAYKQSLKDIEKFLRRKSSVSTPYGRSPSQSMLANKPKTDSFKTPISLHTDVVVTLRSINLGVYPSTFVDSQILMLEAADAQARFAVALEQGKIHSGLGMTLGQLSVALSSIPTLKRSKPIGDLTVEDITESARSARGGTILRVPKVIATMHTWQVPKNNHIDHIFKSSLEGKVDVGWNYSRISHIRAMWSSHSRSLASRLGKPLPESNIKITSSQQQATDSPTTAQSTTASLVPSSPSSPPPTKPPESVTSKDANSQQPGQEKITAVVNVPQSKYEYAPLEPPLIETPQLRDMGEATPPLEWIGLHRDRLPNVTHQIVIVTLLEVAREVEDAYERILGSS